MGSHSHDDESVDGEEIEEEAISPQGSRDEGDWDKGVAPFVKKLTNLVSENRDQVDWTKDGSFVVKDIDIFSSSLLPKYFKAIKLCSFVRQLNMYSFHKVEDAPNASPRSMEFQNEFFIPGRKDLLKKIQRRKTVKRVNGRSDDAEDSKKKVTHEHHIVASSSVDSLIHGVQDETNYKLILQTMAKLQHQTEMNQLALKQVLDELSLYRKMNYDLEQKVSHLTAQVNGQSGMGALQTNFLLQNMLLQQQQFNGRVINGPMSASTPMVDFVNVQPNNQILRNSHAMNLNSVNVGNSVNVASPPTNVSYAPAYTQPEDLYLGTSRGLQTTFEEDKLSLEILQQHLSEVDYSNGF